MIFSLVDKMLTRHGKDCSYVSVSSGVYDIEAGSVVNTETSYSVKTYKKQIKVNQYNYPNLIGREVSVFYFDANKLTVTPKIKDKIVFSGLTYLVDSFQSHIINGEVKLYRITAVLS